MDHCTEQKRLLMMKKIVLTMILSFAVISNAMNVCLDKEAHAQSVHNKDSAEIAKLYKLISDHKKMTIVPKQLR